jgi:hypothetical protein
MERAMVASASPQLIRHRLTAIWHVMCCEPDNVTNYPL